MILAISHVKVYAPSFPQIDSFVCWRRNRSDLQLKQQFQNWAWDNYNVFVPMGEIRLTTDYKHAA